MDMEAPPELNAKRQRYGSMEDVFTPLIGLILNGSEVETGTATRAPKSSAETDHLSSIHSMHLPEQQ